MSQVIVEQKELFKIIDQLEKASNAFVGFVDMLDGFGALLEEDDLKIGEVARPIDNCIMSIKSLTEANQ